MDFESGSENYENLQENYEIFIEKLVKKQLKIKFDSSNTKIFAPAALIKLSKTFLMESPENTTLVLILKNNTVGSTRAFLEFSKHTQTILGGVWRPYAGLSVRMTNIS